MTPQAKRLVFAALLVFSVISCGKNPEQHDSDLTWGIFRDSRHVSSTGLLSLAPNSKICVRGYMAKETVAAIKQWTDAVGRTPNLPAQVDCVDGQRAIEVRGPYDAACEGNIAGYTDTLSFIRVCQQYPANVMTHILLHEVGHMWGLCDQYDGGQDCQLGRVNPNTVMGAASGITRLTADDIEGIKFVTSQPSLGANRAWQSLPTSGSQPPAAPSSTPTASAAASRGQNSSQIGSQAPTQPTPTVPKRRLLFVFRIRFF